MSDRPLVSIVIPTFNHKNLLPSAIDSGLAQTYPHCEIIVVDDGSTDGTEAMLRARYGDRIQYFWQENAGPGAARNRGILAAQGEFIQFCDDDDMLLPTKVERCMDVFEQHPEVAVVYSLLEYVAVDGETPVVLPDVLDLPVLEGDIFCDLLRYNTTVIGPVALLVRRLALLDIGLFSELPALRCAEDWDISLRLADRFFFATVPEPLVRCRFRPNSISRSTYHNTLGRLTALERARDLSKRRACLDDVAFDRQLAGRYHAHASVLWKMGHRREARSAFQRAVELDPAHRTLRRVYAGLCLVVPHAATGLIERGIRAIKRTS